ncbi:serine-rich repeat protein 2, putative [Schistosoma mansoni]|uniref:serine-rich repeat protein 2, putative n=1 Tax=Schistosoma mansoni TaxID=6183 RepID=UPI00022C8388|nr:serine-rich repeat protein 2, putative [Schistosoma mansoni]|eukprot:XP_018645310.1 serine-rich repeat protein 2, putative [Schistosoma mansoni]
MTTNQDNIKISSLFSDKSMSLKESHRYILSTLNDLTPIRSLDGSFSVNHSSKNQIGYFTPWSPIEATFCQCTSKGNSIYTAESNIHEDVVRKMSVPNNVTVNKTDNPLDYSIHSHFIDHQRLTSTSSKVTALQQSNYNRNSSLQFSNSLKFNNNNTSSLRKSECISEPVVCYTTNNETGDGRLSKRKYSKNHPSISRKHTGKYIKAGINNITGLNQPIVISNNITDISDRFEVIPADATNHSLTHNLLKETCSLNQNTVNEDGHLINGKKSKLDKNCPTLEKNSTNKQTIDMTFYPTPKDSQWNNDEDEQGKTNSDNQNNVKNTVVSTGAYKYLSWREKDRRRRFREEWKHLWLVIPHGLHELEQVFFRKIDFSHQKSILRDYHQLWENNQQLLRLLSKDSLNELDQVVHSNGKVKQDLSLNESKCMPKINQEVMNTCDLNRLPLTLPEDWSNLLKVAESLLPIVKPSLNGTSDPLDYSTHSNRHNPMEISIQLSPPNKSTNSLPLSSIVQPECFSNVQNLDKSSGFLESTSNSYDDTIKTNDESLTAVNCNVNFSDRNIYVENDNEINGYDNSQAAKIYLNSQFHLTTEYMEYGHIFNELNQRLRVSLNKATSHANRASTGFDPTLSKVPRLDEAQSLMIAAWYSALMNSAKNENQSVSDNESLNVHKPICDESVNMEQPLTFSFPFTNPKLFSTSLNVPNTSDESISSRLKQKEKLNNYPIDSLQFHNQEVDFQSPKQMNPSRQLKLNSDLNKFTISSLLNTEQRQIKTPVSKVAQKNDNSCLNVLSNLEITSCDSSTDSSLQLSNQQKYDKFKPIPECISCILCMIHDMNVRNSSGITNHSKSCRLNVDIPSNIYAKEADSYKRKYTTFTCPKNLSSSFYNSVKIQSKINTSNQFNDGNFTLQNQIPSIHSLDSNTQPIHQAQTFMKCYYDELSRYHFEHIQKENQSSEKTFEITLDYYAWQKDCE